MSLQPEDVRAVYDGARAAEQPGDMVFVSPLSDLIRAARGQDAEQADLYVSIGNSDDKLSQAEWSRYVAAVDALVRAFADRVHGAWLSESSSEYQNACWACVVRRDAGQAFRYALGEEADRFRQDSIAVAEAVTEFVSATPEGGSA